MIRALLLVGSVLLSPLVTDDCGAGDQSNAGCAPPVAWVQPGAGTVVKVKSCPGLFGVEVRYIQVDSGPRKVWLTDPQGNCDRGDNWVEGAGCD